MILWPCKYPLETLKNGITSIANDTQRITKATSAIVFPPCKSPRIKEAIASAKAKRIIKAAIETLFSFLNDTLLLWHPSFLRYYIL